MTNNHTTLASITAALLIVSALFIGLVNESGNCRRDNTQNCIVVQHVWEMGL